MILPKLYQPEKSQPKQRRLFFLSSMAVGVFLEWAQCCGISSIHPNPALVLSMVLSDAHAVSCQNG